MKYDRYPRFLSVHIREKTYEKSRSWNLKLNSRRFVCSGIDGTIRVNIKKYDGEIDNALLKGKMQILKNQYESK